MKPRMVRDNWNRGLPSGCDIKRVAAAAAITALACTSVTAFADDHGHTEGIVVNVARIRTVEESNKLQVERASV